MKKIFLIFLIFCFITTVNANKYDWLSYSHSDIGYNQACSYYTLKNAGFIKLSDEKINSLNINSWDIKKGIINNPIIEWEHEIEYNVSHPTYKQIEIIEMCEKGWEQINTSYYCGLNHFHCDIVKTHHNINDTCILYNTIESGFYNEIRKKNIWSKISPSFQVSDIEIYPQEEQRFRICSDFQREYTERGYTIEVDHIPEFDNEQYETWTWWNSSYKYKYLINCSNMTDGTPIVINGSSGFKINDTQQIVWTYCSGINMSLYFNNFTDFAVANYSTQIPTEIEYGNGTDYFNSTIWENGTWHNEKVNDADSSGTFGIAKGNSSQNSWFPYIGKYNYLYGADAINITYGNIQVDNTFTLSIYERSMNLGDWQYLFYKAFALNVIFDDTRILIYPGTGMGWGSFVIWNTDISTNNWIFLNFCYDGSVMEIYKNGVSQGSNLMAITSNNNDFIIGDVGATQTYMRIDEFRFNNRVLSEIEINEIYDNKNNINGFGNLYGLENYTILTTTSTTIPYNFEYFGDNILCLNSISGSEFCIKKNNKTLLNMTHDYYLTLKNIEHEKNIKGLFNFMSDHHQSVIRTVIIFIVLSLIGTLGFYYLKK